MSTAMIMSCSKKLHRFGLNGVVVVVVVVVLVNTPCTPPVIALMPPLAALASALVKGNSVTMIEPRANVIGIVANPATPDPLRLARIKASSSPRSVVSKSSLASTN